MVQRRGRGRGRGRGRANVADGVPTDQPQLRGEDHVVGGLQPAILDCSESSD